MKKTHLMFRCVGILHEEKEVVQEVDFDPASVPEGTPAPAQAFDAYPGVTVGTAVLVPLEGNLSDEIRLTYIPSVDGDLFHIGDEYKITHAKPVVPSGKKVK